MQGYSYIYHKKVANFFKNQSSEFGGHFRIITCDLICKKETC